LRQQKGPQPPPTRLRPFDSSLRPRPARRSTAHPQSAIIGRGSLVLARSRKILIRRASDRCSATRCMCLRI